MSFIVWLSLWQVEQKPPFVYLEHLLLLRKKKGDLKGRQPLHVPEWHGFSLVNTSALLGALSTITPVRDYCCRPMRKKGGIVHLVYVFAFLWSIHNAPLDSMESEHSHSGVRNPPHQWGLFPPIGFFSRGNSISEGAACTKHKLSTWRQTGPVYSPFPFIIFYLLVFLRAEKGPSCNFRTSQRRSIRQSAALIADRVEFSTSFALRHDSCSWDGMQWVCLREVWWLKGCQRITSR